MRSRLLLLTLLISFLGHAQGFEELKNTFTQQFGAKDYETAAATADKMIAKAALQFGRKHVNYAVALYCGGEANYYLLKFPKAISCYNGAIETLTAINQTDQTDDVASMRNSIGTIYNANKKYDSAIYYYKAAAEYYLKAPNVDYNTLYTVCDNLMEACTSNGQPERVVVIADKLLPVITAQPEVNTEHHYSTLIKKAQSLYLMRDWSNAADAFENCLPLSEKLNGKPSSDYSAVETLVFRCCRFLVQNDKATGYLIAALNDGRASDPADTVFIADLYGEGGGYFSDIAAFSSADSLFAAGIDWCKRTGLQTTNTYVKLLYQQGAFYLQSAREQQAASIFNEALSSVNTGEEDADALEAQLLAALSNAEMQLGQFANVEKHAQAALAILKNVKPAGSAEEATAYQALGMLYNRVSTLERSVAAFEKAIDVSHEVFGPDNKFEAIICSNLGNAYAEHAEYAKAEAQHTTAMNIAGKIYGKEHPFYATSLVNMGVLYMQQGRIREADALLGEAITIYSKNEMMNSVNAQMAVNSLAYMYLLIGDYKTARSLYNDLIDELNPQDPNNINVLSYVYHNVAMTLEFEFKFDSVVYYENKVLQLLQQNGRSRSDVYIKSAMTLMRAYMFIGGLAEATKLEKELVTLTAEVMGEESETMSKVLGNIAWLEKKKGDTAAAAANIVRSSEIIINKFRKNFYALSEKEKLQWWSMGTLELDAFPVLMRQMNVTTGPYVAQLLEQRLQLKGFVLEDAAGTLKKLRADGSPGIQRLIDEWQAAKSLLAKMYSVPVSERTLNTDSLEQAVNLLEKNISGQAAAGVNLSQKKIRWTDLRDQLKDDEAAIEFFSYRYYDGDVFRDSMVYAAAIVRKNAEFPQLVYLPGEKVIARYLTGSSGNTKEENINRLYRASIKSSGENNFPGDSLYDITWRPLMPFLNGIRKISFAPDGILHKIAFQALPVHRGTFLIDSFQLQQYSSVKQLLDGNTPQAATWKSALLIGNPDFNHTTSSGKDISFTGTGDWPQLAGTGREVAAIQTLLNSRGIKTKTLTSTAASEDNFKNIQPNYPDIIHLSTHGFFLKDTMAGKTIVTEMGSQPVPPMNPLLRSGLILAGGNKAWSGEKLPPEAEDGILNAYEISQLNLSATKLVVLSACETALGEVQGGEGVFGLQRAFKLAGVKNLVVSLWQVPDKETAELMTLFYSNLLNKQAVRDAFYNAQKEMRKKYGPFSWAAFILIE